MTTAVQRNDRGDGVWARWVAANALGEMIGLGAATLLGVALTAGVTAAFGAQAPAAMMAVFVIGGTFEGAVIGVAQWTVLRQPLPELRLRQWLVATMIGAFIAWVLGSLPSTLMAMAPAAAAGSPAGANPLVELLLAAGLGLVAGPILGVGQAVVLRQHIPGSMGRWVLANGLAWAAGMPLIFLMAGSVPAAGITVGFAAFVLVGIGVVGAVVGAVHGLFLAGLLRAQTA
ncbi:MAG: hypothetical protein GYB64_01880 [Chloroflexi bacterium]|nr:hypothetical protein [Chloroflexota bacterium]